MDILCCLEVGLNTWISVMNKARNMLFFVRSCHGSYGKQELVMDAERSDTAVS